MAGISDQAARECTQALQEYAPDVVVNAAELKEAMLTVRNRLRSQQDNQGRGEDVNTMAYCLQPLWDWQSVHVSALGLDSDDVSNLTWNLFCATVSRTKLAEKFAAVADDSGAWEEMMVLLRNSVQEGEDLPLNWPWLSKKSLTGFQVLGLLFAAGIASLFETGRSRAWAMFAFTSQAVLLALWVQFGFDIGGRRKIAKPPKKKVKALDQPSVSSASTLLKQENEALKLQLEQARSNPVDPPLPPPAGAPPLPCEGSDAAPVAQHEVVASPVAPLQASEASPVVPSQATHALQVELSEQAQSQAVTGPFVVLEDAAVKSVGDIVVLKATASMPKLAGVSARITAVDEQLHEAVVLDGLMAGLVIKRLSAHHFTEAGSAPPAVEQGASSQQCYAPFASSIPSQLKAQAGRLKEALVKAHGFNGTLPGWAKLFWQAVKNEQDIYTIAPELQKSLRNHGWVGPDTLTAPRFDELKKELTSIEITGGPPHGAAANLLEAAQANAFADASQVQYDGPEQMQWHLQLSEGLQRAAPEIYWSIRSEGATSVRNFISSEHSFEQRSTPGYQERFASATIIDFELKDCTTPEVLSHKLATSDTLEIELRKIGAWIYERRTGDKAGALRILAVRAPGSQTDVIPKWLLEEATLHSKNEYQRAERVSKMKGLGKGGKGDGGSPGSGKPKGGKAKGKAKPGKGAPQGGGGTQG